jgi:uncharacterized protein (DUF58 family)
MDAQVHVPLFRDLLTSGVRGRMRRFLLRRIAPRDTVTLTQRNVYIGPSGPGWALGLTLLVLLVASINYQLNLGYLLTFLLAGSALVGMHLGHSNLRGLRLNLLAPPATYAGRSVTLQVQLISQGKRMRYGVGAAVWGTTHWSWNDVPAQGSATAQISFRTERRGLQALPPLCIETRFPLGTFRVWTVWRPAAQVLVYPEPEPHAPALPLDKAKDTPTARSPLQQDGDFDGVRAYRRGDPPKTILWKKAAKSDTLVSRDREPLHGGILWLDMAHTGSFAGLPGGLEQRLARLCAWTLAAHAQQRNFGLRLGLQEVAPGSGEEHLRTCLRTLALYPKGTRGK